MAEMGLLCERFVAESLHNGEAIYRWPGLEVVRFGIIAEGQRNNGQNVYSAPASG